MPPSQLSYLSSGSTDSINITSNGSWTVVDNQSWISTSPTNGSGNGKVTITVTAHSSTFTRAGQVTISENDGSGVPDQQISISQDGVAPILNVSTTELLFGGSQTQTFTISSNTNWSISITYYDSNGWLNFTPGVGSGNATITVTSTSANANDWEAELEITTGSIYKYIDVVKYY